MKLTNFVESPFAILLPPTAMGLWALLNVLRLGLSRKSALESKLVKIGYYQLYQASEKDKAEKENSKNAGGPLIDGEPPALAKISQHVENLFETPQVFYAVCAFLQLVGDRSGYTLAAAWAYFFARLAHSFVSLTSNYVPHRFVTFATSIAIAIGLYGRLGYVILSA
jgi:hypothetical protein